MEGVGIAASILAIATAGVQTSIKLTSFSNQVTTAADRIRSIGSAVSLTSNVLQQIGELMTSSDGNAATSIFNNNSLRTTQASAEACERIFQALKDVLMKSSKQLLQQKDTISGKVILSKLEALKWPFFQPGIDTLCMDLRDARETLMLILQVTTLAYSKKLAALWAVHPGYAPRLELIWRFEGTYRHLWQQMITHYLLAPLLLWIKPLLPQKPKKRFIMNLPRPRMSLVLGGTRFLRRQCLH